MNFDYNCNDDFNIILTQVIHVAMSMNICSYDHVASYVYWITLIQLIDMLQWVTLTLLLFMFQ